MLDVGEAGRSDTTSAPAEDQTSQTLRVVVRGTTAKIGPIGDSRVPERSPAAAVAVAAGPFSFLAGRAPSPVSDRTSRGRGARNAASAGSSSVRRRHCSAARSNGTVNVKPDKVVLFPKMS